MESGSTNTTPGKPDSRKKIKTKTQEKASVIYEASVSTIQLLTFKLLRHFLLSPNIENHDKLSY